MKNLKLGAKIGGGFGMLIVIAMILGGLAVINMSKASFNAELMAVEYAPEVRLANEIERTYLLAMLAIRSYALVADPAYLQEGRGHFKTMHKLLEDAKVLATKSGHLIKLRASVDKIEAGLVQYEKFTGETETQNNKDNQNRQNMDAAAKQFMDNAYAFQKSQIQALDRETVQGADPAKLRERQVKINAINDIIDQGNVIRVANFKAQAVNDMKIASEALVNFDAIDKKVADITNLVHVEANQRQLKNIQAAGQAYRKAINEFMSGIKAMDEISKVRNQVARDVLVLIQETSKSGIANTQDLATESEDGLRLSMWVMVVGLVIALLLGVIVAILITKNITTPVRITVDAVGQAAKGDFSFSVDEKLLRRGDELGEMMRDVDKMAENLSVVVTESMAAAETVATSAGEISQGNQDLSERTQQQASAIEETASSIEEMTSSVKQNAGNSQQANDLARRTSTMSVQGGQVVERTVGAMGAVTESSRKISDIINVVNEIAFQTNLLALNAAVEAARAGEAGRGFAVVAGEVRNLAGRSAAAAKEIQALITDSVAKVEQGNELVA
ncbi:MAG: methyl-accepting chemotaxis protein, partial [Pseudomonadota bacterium]